MPDAASNTSELKSPENPEAGGKGKAVLTPEQIETIRKNREQALERKRARAEMDGTVGESAAKKILVPEESIMDAAGKFQVGRGESHRLGREGCVQDGW